LDLSEPPKEHDLAVEYSKMDFMGKALRLGGKPELTGSMKSFRWLAIILLLLAVVILGQPSPPMRSGSLYLRVGFGLGFLLTLPALFSFKRFWRLIPGFFAVIFLFALGSDLLGYNPEPSGVNSARARAMATQLKMAVQGYDREYGHWPPTDADGRIDNHLLYRILTGQDPVNNPRQILFMEFNLLDLDDPNHPTVFVDPWWKKSGENPLQTYTVTVHRDDVNVSDPGRPDGKKINADPNRFIYPFQ